MPRMFDILRGQGPDDKNSNKGKEAEKNIPLAYPKAASQNNKALSSLDDYTLASRKLIDAVRKNGIDNSEAAKKVYDDAVYVISGLLSASKSQEDLSAFAESVMDTIDSVYQQLLLGDKILVNIYKPKPSEYYLPYHIVNILILSVATGLSMKFNKSRIDGLALAAIFSDTGIEEVKDIVIKPRKLTEEEKCWVEAHVSKSLKFAERVLPLNDNVKEAIQMHHERVNGKGYPRGLKQDAIAPYAKIIGLIDTYEAMTHKRNYLEELGAHKAIRLLISSLRDAFDTHVLRVFINKMSLYPIGSLVALDSNEIARVVSAHPGSPLRPIVQIIRDTAGNSLEDGAIIDLSIQGFPAIQDSF
ncbi:MAG: HD domain-containing phosphohydrolase [Candidatus Omnitrophota bacterium]